MKREQKFDTAIYLNSSNALLLLTHTQKKNSETKDVNYA